MEKRPWETENWLTSEFNYWDEVRSGLNLPENVLFYDATLRDGEQAPGIHLNVREKIEIAEQLSRLNVDIIEAGFPRSSAGDFESVKEVAKVIKGRGVAGLARANDKDIDAAGEALKGAERPVIHTFISSSELSLIDVSKVS